MVVQEKLQGLTEAYLLSLIAEALESDIDESKMSIPFQELGIDSFRILKIIKKLEADFGTLPKTLLFENFNVLDLTRYFLEKHPQILEKKFTGQSRPTIARPSAPAPSETPRPAAIVTCPILIREREAYASPELSATVKAIFDRHKNEGSVSRGTRNIAPHLFIGAERQGFFHFSRSGNIFLAYAYTGPDTHFPELARQALEYCREQGLEFNLFAAEQVREVGGTAFTATPFGAIQRIENLGAFTLQGNRMRRLRYQVSKFEGGGACRTEEHCCGSDPEKAKAIADLIDRWCAAKTMVNPLIHIVKAEILAGTLSPDHRIFLTYMGGVLQNAILITPLRPEDNGYLMDLEFYPAEMPLGGLEYAIANIVKILVAEGRSLLSLGGTYGVKLDASPNADPGIEKILETLREQNLFNDEGNLQFKNKFRTENRSVYLCRPAAGSNPDNITDIIMMIADPAKYQSPDPEPIATLPIPVHDPLPAPGSESALPPQPPSALPRPEPDAPEMGSGRAGGEAASLRIPEAEGRRTQLSEAGFNPLNVPDDQVQFDLKTDSWSMLVLPSLDAHIGRLHSRLQEPVDLEASLKSVFPFRHFVLAGSGREAEHAFFKAAGRKGVVLQNLLFPSTLFNQIDNGFTPVELPSCDLLDPAASKAIWQGGPDWDALCARVEANPQSIAYVCLEVDDNAAGGSPMSFQRLKALKEFLSAHAIPLILDGTRIVDYARQLIAEDPAMTGRPIWDVVREICLQADVLLASLTKDFCVKSGGLIALNDASQYHKVQDLVQEEGIGLDVIDKKLVALSLQQKDAIEALVSQRMDAVRFLADELARQGVLVARPARGHCILIHVTSIPEFRSFRHPVASFLAWMYLGAGIRGSAHNAGMLKGTYLNDCVRLAIPVGMTKESVREVAALFAALFATKTDIPELATEGDKPLVPGDVHTRYRVTAVHGASSRPAAAAAPGAAEALHMREPVPTYGAYQPAAAVAGIKATAPMAIAIVGMAGRYPKSRNMAELWENLCQGRDCIETLPEERFQQRLRHGFAKKYRGGFIDGVDRFDSLFFSISPREAEGLDPQERLFLEAAWEAIEDAGYYPETLVPEKAPRDVGVFVGAVWAMYQMLGAEEKLAGNDINPNSFLWSIANRVSYFLNLTGPSLTLDTACSSSLTALHLACEAIRKGECSSAIVGGVNLDLHQSKWDINKAGGALSEDGICRTFGKGANGYVAGEGIGAVFLKPLDQALRDGDNVQAVIRSVVVNHGGKTSGYTVPNPHAQTRLIQAALKQTGLDARTIGYIEAHGTGTELGDPIEISGLANAFQAFQVEKQSCSVGSVKTNIGHLEAAAGLVGLQKVALQMSHGQLVPSLHSAELNGFIDFAGSPFYVQQKTEPWLAKEVDGIKHPLRAGVSSFGAGGANAHVIVERYEGPLRPRGDSGAEQVFPLSARSEEQLRDAAIRLREHLLRDLARGEESRQNLDDMSFTLRVGRKSFDHRLAVVATSKEELLGRLGTFLEGGKDASVLAGHVKNAAGITKMLNRQEKEAFIQLLSRDRDPRKLAQLWTDGLLADWQGSQPEGTGRRVSLPTYPFAGKRHWVERKAQAALAPGNGPAALHPMIDANESTFERQVFRKTFHDRQFFIFDHLVSGIPTLPGVAYLDFARKAGELAAGRRVKSIRNILWISPITVAGGKPTRAFIELKPQGDSVQFEVFGEGQDGKRQPFSQGRITYAPLDGEASNESIDLAAVQARCRKVMDGKDAYPKFKAFGLDLGPSFQVLQEVSKSDEEVLGKLRIPEHILGEFQDFLLHPSLVDGSLQAGMAAQLGGAAKEMFVPYSIGEVEILHPLQPLCYSYVRSANAPGSKVSKANVLIVDETGKVLVKILDSVGVPLTSVHEKPAASASPSDATEFPKLFYAPDWIDAPAAAAAPNLDPILFLDREGGLGTLYRERLAAAGGDPRRAARVRPGSAYAESGDLDYTIDPRAPGDWQRLCESLAKAGFALGKICFAWPLSPDQDGQARAEEATEAGDALRQALDHSVFALFHLAQALAKNFPGGKLQILYAFTGGDGAFVPHHEAINGFVRTLRIEHPKINAKVLEIREPVPGSARLLDLLLAELECDTQEVTTVRFADGGRKVRTLKKFDPAKDAALGAASPRATGFKDKGVYLITGGAGGLGLLFAEHLAERHAARLVLTGRSPLSAEKESRLEAMRKLGAEVAYIVADVSRRKDADRLIQETKARYGSLQGIIHSAGVLRDAYLKNKTREEMEAVFAPKLFGTLNLDRATRSEGLDFFVTFSSLAALGGNAGQADYAYANHFMDGFSRWREGLRDKGERSGKTLSINWSLWADGGMKLDEQTELFFRRNLGIKPLGREAGIEALATGLSLDIPQFAALEGMQEKIELAWGLRKKEPAAPPAASAQPASSGTASSGAGSALAGAAADQGELAALVQGELIRIAMEMLKLDADDIAPDKILLDLGFDSIGMTTYANAINELYKLDITPVLFFEFPSIQDIARHLCAERKDEIAAYHHRGAAASSKSAAPAAPAPRSQEEIRFDKGWKPAPAAPELPASGAANFPRRRFVDMPIAVVGMSGVMPQSDDLEEFWENLREARNLVTEIPRDRWKWEEFDGDPLKERNKTNSKWGGFMREVDKFDPLFFGISPREAEMMDPQQRIFLETVWKAIEDSGHKVSDLAGTKTGLFVGAATRDYADVLASHQCTLDGYTASGNSHSVLVNRVSFLLNLRGPSAPLDTACSSSLVALHRAIESIHSGSCEMAIVGGVQLMLTPSAYISFSAAGMLSPDGKCKSFDKAANGYVRGEGSGAILLKPLAMAEADGDRILAVIKATAENHGGRVTALTAPNPNAQTELLVEAYGKGQVDPATVGFIECHGTGTSLGDPIEIQALSKAFATLYKEHGKPIPAAAHCGLSSVKTNIGHLETAAGIAGVLKVLLALRHKQIPANLHFQEMNPYINLKGTPFFIADKTTDWECAKDEAGNPLPRRAGVSSFGFGGANAHVVFEEYPAAHPSTASAGPQLIVISAKNEDRLRAYAASHVAHLGKHTVGLADMAFTLQVGRDEMPERLAVVADSAEDLRGKLAAWLEGKLDPDPVYRGNARKPKEKPPGTAAAKAMAERKDLAKLAEAWIAGEAIEWRLLHQGEARQRIALPTYPFARDRHWFAIPELPASEGTAVRGRVPALHPLVHRNISTLSEQKFLTELTGEEFFLDEHRVESRKILPGVAYLEMARAAGEIAGEAPVRVLRNIVWLRPLFSEGGAEKAEISLVPDRDGVEFAIRSHGKPVSVTYCTGKLGYELASGDPVALDLDGIRKRCLEEVIDGKGLYEYLHGMGLHLGKGFQIVQGISATPTEALARLRLPDHLQAGADKFWLHPALLDGSLHTSIGLTLKNGTALAAGLPFTAREIQILEPLTRLRYAYATFAEGEERAEPGARKLNVTLLDEQGRVLVRVKEFFMKPFSMEAAKKLSGSSETAARGASAPTPKAELQALVPVWKPIPSAAAQASAGPARPLLLGGSQEQLSWLRKSYPQAACLDLPVNADIAALAAALEGVLEGARFDHLLWMAPDLAGADEPANLIKDQEKGVLEVFRLIKALLHLKYGKQVLRWTLITGRTTAVRPGDALRPAHAGLAGLVGSLAKEYPRWQLGWLDVDSLESITAGACLTADRNGGDGLAWRGGEWYRQELASRELTAAEAPAYKHRGVYVVIGGAGGLGEVWSRFMIERFQARLVWVGRRAADADIEGRIAALGRLGTAPLYVQADAADLASLQAAAEAIKLRYPAIHGVVHSALVLQDQSLMNMDLPRFASSLSAKVDVSVNMDKVFGEADLDFMLFFSSMISFFKTPGQSNYAAGCAFKDSFARHLAAIRPYPVLVMNWGYWGHVGVAGDEASRKRLEQVGIGSIEPGEAMEALQSLVASDIPQLYLIKTVAARAASPAPAPAPEPHQAKVAVAQRRKEAAAPASVPEAGKDAVQRVLVEKLSASLKIDGAKIPFDGPFVDYGVDSIIGVNLVNSINESLGIDLEVMVLFDYSTINQLTEHILSRFKEKIEALLAVPAVPAVPVASVRQTALVAKAAPSRPREMPKPRFFSRAAAEAAADAVRPEFEPIAIIGMSGRFAGSANLEEFWSHLRAGKNLVSEITRWRKQDCVMSQFVDGKYCSRGSFIDGIDKFDSAFFQISSLEANYMDPQQRLFLEEAWRAMEDAGYAGSVDGKNCGVYVGCGSSGYESLFAEDPPAQAFWGNSDAVLPARIAYHLNLQGPAVAIDTACSASLVGMHIACQGLWARETEMALAGGVFLASNSGFYKVANRAGMLSPEGKCQAFDDKADGFVPGEGVGVVVLKRLSDALRDHDSIYGVIAGSGINQDGKTNGIIAPSAASQERLERAVYDRFGIDPGTIQVIEAHGTGTRLGDPIEFGALTRAFRKYTDRKQFCAIGSVKTNIGHAATAAGVAGVLKLLLALKHREIPPSLHFEQGNAAIDFPSSPFFVNAQLRAWESTGKRRAAISSFGFSGTNAHLVLEEAPAPAPNGIQAPGYLVVLSAASPEQLRRQVENLLAHCRRAPDLSMNDLCYTLFVGRAHLNHRLTCVTRDPADLVRTLEAWVAHGSAAQANAYAINRSKLREQGALKAFGNQCIRACAEVAESVGDEGGARYLEHLTALADLYGQGYSLDYTALFPQGSRRISLPTYPFAGESHWAEMAQPGAAAAKPGREAISAPTATEIHPLLHENISVLNQQRYCSVFSGAEPFLASRAQDGRRLFPEAAYLEMARAAVEDASPWHAGIPFELRDVSWGPPADCREGRAFEVTLSETEEGRIDFVITSWEDNQETLHCRGLAEPNTVGEDAAAPVQDIAKLKSLLGGVRPRQPGAQQILVPFEGPKIAEEGTPAWVIVPGVLESAFRAAAQLLTGPTAASTIPESLESLRIFAPLTGGGHAWVRSARRVQSRHGAAKFDVDLLDPQGRVVAQVRSLAFAGSAAAGSGSLVEFNALLASFGGVEPADSPQGGHDSSATEVFANLLDEIR